MAMLLHCGASEISFSDLAAIPAPPATESWAPVAHSAFVEAISTSLDIMGATTYATKLAIKPGKTGADKFFGYTEFSHPHITPRRSGTAAIIYRSSWDKSFAQSGSLGYSEFICDNLALRGDNALNFHRKSTPGLSISYQSIIAGAMVNLIADATRFVADLNRFDTLVLDQSPTNIDNIACSLADHDAVLWQNVPHLRRELTRLDGPGGFFPERAHALTAGLVMQAITETEKRSYNVLSSPRRLAAATSYLTETYA